jgi:hypothetical protein
VRTHEVSPADGLKVPLDGTRIRMGTLNLLPTSRGTVRLSSADLTIDRLICPEYYATEIRRVVTREDMCPSMHSTGGPEGKQIVEKGSTSANRPQPTSISSDTGINERVNVAASWCRPTSSCLVAKVANTDLRVKTAGWLRIVVQA